MIEKADKTFSFAGFELDTVARRLLKNGENVPLNPKAFDLLLALVAHHGQILSKDALLDKVWEGQFVEENNLTVHITALRKILGEKKGDNRFIVTVPGKGYKFVHDLNESANAAIIVENHKIERILINEEVEAPPGSSQPAAAKRSHRRTIFAILGAALVILPIAFLAFRYFSAPPAAQIGSLAVLPFVNQNGDADAEYLSDGLAESVIYALSQTPNLRVMSRNSVFRYKGKETDAKTVGAELNVQAVLTGRVTQRGDFLDISAELISTADNSVIWGERFTRQMTDVEKLQNDIAASISEKLRLKFSGVKPSGTESAEAYQLYLKGLYHWHKRTDLKQAVELFQKAIEKDPGYAKAYAGLAMTYNVLPGNMVLTPDEVQDARFKAKAAAQKALELDNTLAEPHAVLGDQKNGEWDFAGAESHFKRAIDLNPNFAAARQWYSAQLSAFGRHDEALSEIKKAYELDPFSPAVNLNIGLRYARARRYDEAVAQLKKLINTEPSYPTSYLILGDIYAELRRYEDAFEMWCRGNVLRKRETPEECAAYNAELRDALKKDGETGYQRKLLEQALKAHEKGRAPATSVAAVYAQLGDRENAYQWLEKAFVRREGELLPLKVNPAFDNLRSEARFKDLLRRIGLPE